jgi:hypothetical protein
LSFHFLMVSFEPQKIFFFIKSICLFFPFVIYAFGVMSKKPNPSS